MNIEDKLRLILIEYLNSGELRIENARHYQKVILDKEVIAIYFFFTREIFLTKYFSLYFMLPPESGDKLVKVFFEEVIHPGLDFPHDSKTYKFAGLYNPN